MVVFRLGLLLFMSRDAETGGWVLHTVILCICTCTYAGCMSEFFSEQIYFSLKINK